MDEEAKHELEPTHEVELISDGENLLVLGEDRRSVEGFLRSKGLLAMARQIGRHQLAPALRSSAHLAKTMSDTMAESSLWLKQTPDSAAAVEEYGLTETGVPGVAWGMAGARGDIKQWLKIDTSLRAQAGNPAFLSGAAGMLAQSARQQEAAQLRELLKSLDQKLDKVIRGQNDEILGDLAGIEHQIRVTQKRLNTEGEIDALTWSALFSASVGLRQVQAKALLKLQGIAEDLGDQKRFGDLNQRLHEARGEARKWLTVVTRCVTALDDLAVLELDYYAVLEPHRLDARRVTLDRERQDDRIELDERVSVLVQRMDESATTANQNKLFHVQGVPKALDSIEMVRDLVKRVYDALGVDVCWESIDPMQWRDAIRQAQQWKNGLQEGGSLAWEKGSPVLGKVAMAALVSVATAAATGKKFDLPSIFKA